MKVLYSRMTDRNKARNVTLSKLRGTDGGVKSKATTCRLSDSYRSSVTDSQREGSRRPRSATRTSPLMKNDQGWSPDDSLVGSITTIQQTSIQLQMTYSSVGLQSTGPILEFRFYILSFNQFSVDSKQRSKCGVLCTADL